MLKLYNTLTRKKEEFVPIHDDRVTMYSCGPTVYSFAHIGNMRTYIFMDLVRRVLKYDGYNLLGVMNITDVGHLTDDGDNGEDKMVKAAQKQKKTPEEIAAFYTDVFMQDIAKLNIGKPEIIAKATEHIDDMIKFVEALCEKGYGYEITDGIYYDISKFPHYGSLSGINLDEQKSGARVEVNDEKKNPIDFALWKHAPKEHIMKWESPWGLGYPGWHIECSAMSKKYLGFPFDIHSGGVDHIPIHHENEIAQNEGYTDGQKTVNYWIHGEFMLVNNGKMSKSLGNTYTVSDLEAKGYAPLDFRYFCLNANYGKKLNFTFDGLDSAKTARQRLNALLYSHKIGTQNVPQEALDDYKAKFVEAINDDINIPQALGILWTMLKENKSKQVYELALEMDKIFGLDFDKVEPIAQQEEKFDCPQEVVELAEKRAECKKNKDYAKADEIRGQIKELGYSVVDTKDGFKIIKN